MFYFLISSILMYNWILIMAAVIPAVFLMVKVYRSDRLEKESPALLRSLAVAGVLSSLLALVEEKVFSTILGAAVPAGTVLYNVILYFVIVAFSEESSKYIFLRKRTWQNPEFNCQYDGVVYAVFVSLGFALWENISYVMSFGFSTAIVRAITAIPGHACFGVFMGIFYGIAKKYERLGAQGKAKFFSVLSLVIPAFLHGAYDYIATLQQMQSGWYFVIFIAALFTVTFTLVDQVSKGDRFID